MSNTKNITTWIDSPMETTIEYIPGIIKAWVLPHFVWSGQLSYAHIQPSDIEPYYVTIVRARVISISPRSVTVCTPWPSKHHWYKPLRASA